MYGFIGYTVKNVFFLIYTHFYWISVLWYLLNNFRQWQVVDWGHLVEKCKYFSLIVYEVNGWRKRGESCHILENLLWQWETSNTAKDSEYGKSFGDLGNNKFWKDVVIVRLGNIPSCESVSCMTVSENLWTCLFNIFKTAFSPFLVQSKLYLFDKSHQKKKLYIIFYYIAHKLISTCGAFFYLKSYILRIIKELHFHAWKFGKKGV